MVSNHIDADQEDARESLWKHIDGTTLCVTGSTGIVCSYFVKMIISFVERGIIECHLVLPVRNINKAKKMFGESSCISYYQWSMDNSFPEIQENIDYLVHGACPTSSSDFVKLPVETVMTICHGTCNVLDYCKNKKLKKVILLSTMEVYGEISGKINEKRFGSLDSMAVRNSYPESKKISELLFSSYYKEYQVPTCVLRLAQSFGSGVRQEDRRVFAEFAQCAIKKQDITLYSDGSNKSTYISLRDASYAILFVLLMGECGQAYNAANEKTYCSILEMAHLVLKYFGTPNAQIVFGYDDSRSESFRKSSQLFLDASKLRDLGWEAHDDLLYMYDDMINAWSL